MATAKTVAPKNQVRAKRGKDKTPKNMQLPAKTLESLYTTMRRIRAFEQRTTELFNDGVVKGTRTATWGKRPLPRQFALIYKIQILSQAITEGTGTASQKVLS